MKYFILFMVFFCAIGAGLAIANKQYGLAALDIFCVFINMQSLQRLSTTEEDKEDKDER